MRKICALQLRSTQCQIIWSQNLRTLEQPRLVFFLKKWYANKTVICKKIWTNFNPQSRLKHSLTFTHWNELRRARRFEPQAIHQNLGRPSKSWVLSGNQSWTERQLPIKQRGWVPMKGGSLIWRLGTHVSDLIYQNRSYF